MASPGNVLHAGPSRSYVAVTPSNDTDLAQEARSLYVGTTGNVSVLPPDPDITAGIVFVGVAAGTFLVIGVRRVLATGTTASDIVALY